MSSKVQAALEARKKRKKEEEKKRFSVEDALKERNSRIETDFGSTLSSLQEGITKEAETYKSLKNLSFGTDLKGVLDSTNESRVNLGNLKRKVEAYRKQLGGDKADEILSYIDQMQSGYKSYLSNAEIFSAFKTEADYNQWVSDSEEYEKKKTIDLDAAQKEIEKLEAEYERLYGRGSYTSEDPYTQPNKNGVPPTADQVKKRKEESQKLTTGTSSTDTSSGKQELEKLISEKKLYLTQAKRIQEGIRLSGVADPESEFYDPEFDSFDDYKGTSPEDWHDSKDNLYEYVNNYDDFRSKYKDHHRTMSSDNPFSDGVSSYEEKAYDFLNEQEIAIFNYYYAKDGKEAAEKYLDNLQETLNHRKATSMFEGKLEGNTVSEILFGAAAGVDQFESGIKNLFNTEDDYIPTSAVQMASQMVREDLGDDGWKLPEFLGGASLGQVAYDITTTTSNMLPSVIVGAATNPIVGTSLLGASAAGNAYQEMINFGYDKGQARMYSTLVGASEALLEYALGGITKLGGKATGGAVTKLLSKVDNAFGRAAIRFGGSMLSEGFEEGLQEYLEPWFKSIAFNTDYEAANLDEILYSGLLGALSAFGLEGTHIISSELATYSQGKNLKTYGEVDRLVELGKTFSADSVAAQIAGKVNKDTGAYTIGRLFNEVGASLSETNITDITNALVERGIDQSQAATIAKWMANTVNGVKLTKKQQAALENNPVIADVWNDVIINPNSTVMQRSMAYSYFSDMSKSKSETKVRDTDDLFSDPETVKAIVDEGIAAPEGTQSKALATEYSEILENGGTLSTEQIGKLFEANKEVYPAEERHDKYGVGVDGKVAIFPDVEGETAKVKTFDKTTGKKVANFKEISNISPDGKVAKLRLEDASEIDAKNLNIGSSSDSMLVEGLLDMTVDNVHLDAGTANALLKEMRNSIKATLSNRSAFNNLTAIVAGTREALTYGYYGYDSKQLMSDKGMASEISDSLRSTAYVLGRDLGKERKASNHAKITDAIEERKHSGIEKAEAKGKLRFAEGEQSALEGLSSDQKAVVDFFRDIAVATPSGMKLVGYSKDYNGYTNMNTGEMVFSLDSNASRNPVAAVLFTAGHESGHYIKLYNPEGFRRLGEFLAKEYGKKGESVHAHVLAMQKKSKNNLTYDEAHEEWVCQSLQRMFASVINNKDSGVLQRLQQYDNKVAQLLYKALSKLASKISSLLEKLTPGTFEEQFVAEMDATARKLFESMYAEELVTAIDNAQWLSGVDVMNDILGNKSIEVGKASVQEMNRRQTRFQEKTEYEAQPKEIISVGTEAKKPKANRKTLGGRNKVTIAGKTFGGDVSVKELRDARFVENGFSQEEIDKHNEFIQHMADMMKEARVKYRFIGLDDIYNAKILVSPTSGEIVLSALVNNGDYPINFDFTKICKKRVALQQIVDQLAREKGKKNSDGTVTEVNLSPENIKAINDILADAGIETACLCCFVESKRYNIQSLIQENVIDVWNSIVDEFDSNAGYFNFADESVNESKIPDKEFDALYEQVVAWRKQKGKSSIPKDKMYQFLETTPAARKKLRFSDLVTEKGRTNLHKLYPDIEGLIGSTLGTAAPKSVEAFAPYNGEIDLMESTSETDMSEYLFSIAGARSQSFSDFMIAHIFDVVQKTASLSARKFPAHVYTKEIARARLFGMTGEKHNMSVLFNIDPEVDSWNAGLKKDGSYFLSDYKAYSSKESQYIQSIGWDDAVNLQNTEGYSKDCGIIAVGFSYNNMIKIHNDPDVRQVIGYHTSSLPAVVKPLTNLDKATDYTPVQNTLAFVGFVKPMYAIPEGVPSYATPPQDVQPTKGTAKTQKVSDTFDIKATFNNLAKGKKGKARTLAAKETLRQLLEYAESNGLALKTQKAEGGHGDFDLYSDVEQTKNPYMSADHYIEYCIERGYLPAFYEFSMNPNYYKDIFDFNVFDRLSYNPETGLHEDSDGRQAYAPQTAVHMLNEDGSYAFPSDFFEIVDKQMKNYDEYSHMVKDTMPDVLKKITSIDGMASNLKLQERESDDAKAFARDIDQWNREGKPNGESFILGSTGDVLQGLGAIESDIYMLADKINEILKSHPEMTLDEIKKIPQILENPILILKSRGEGRGNRDNTRLVIFGSVKAKDNRPILSVLDLRPQEDNLVIDDMQKVTSAYTKDNNPVAFVRNSYVLYADKNKTTKLLRTIGFQMPIELQLSGYIGSISYKGQNVNIKGESFSNIFKEGSEPTIRYQERGYAPTFYSQMGKVVEGVKQEKLAANSVVNMLRGKGVKAEEIRWSGIVPFLEGKKSVTKQELLDFINGSMLQIGEQMSSNDIDLRYDTNSHAYIHYDAKGNVVDTYTYNEFIGGYVSEASEEIYSDPYALEDALREEYGKMSSPRWAEYKLEGGENYREIVFTMPNSSYTNRAMRGHWGEDAEGVLVHARIQDFDVNGKKMLFVEELQSDWHNEGHSKGYSTKEYEDAVESQDKLYNQYKKLDLAFHKYVRSNEFMTDPEDVRKKKHDWLRGKAETAQKKYLDAEKAVTSLKEKGAGDTPDAPFKDTYHEYVMKRLLRMAAEEGYDSIGWTPADIQSKRWSEDYAEGYRIEYDQDIPKFLRKYGRQWDAKVGSTNLPNGAEVWSMDITDSMKNSVLYEGQVMYQEKDYVITDNRAAFTEKHINDLYEDYSVSSTSEMMKDYAQAYVAYINPSDFLSITSLNGERIRNEAVELDLEKLRAKDDRELPYLEFDEETGEVYEHDGRHRLVAFENAGIEQVAIRLLPVSQENKYRRKKVNITLEGQEFHWRNEKGEIVSGKAKGKVTVTAYPLSPSCRPEIEKLFGTGKMLYQERSTEDISNRGLLANALETAAKDGEEKNLLRNYKTNIRLIEAEQKKLSEIKDKLFAKGSKIDPEERKKLQFEMKQTSSRINSYDRQLLKLEAMQPIQKVLTREKEMAKKRQKQKDMQLLADYKEKSKATVRELLERNQESRKKAIERRDMAIVRNKIKAFKTRLESSLLRPTDRSYVPFGLVQAVVDVCDIINTDTDLYKADGTINKAQEQRNLTKEKLQTLKDEYEKLKDYEDPVYSGEFDDAVYYMLKDLRERYDGRSLKEMTLGELSDMYDILRSIGDTLADARKLIGKGEAYDVYEAGYAIIGEQGEVAKKRKKDKRNGMQKAKDSVINLSLSPVRNVERMSGYKDGSVLVDLFNDFEVGVRQKNFFEMESKKSFEGVTTGENAKAYESAVYDVFKEYVDDKGRKFGISKMQMMQAVLSQDREKANRMHHIKGGGLVFADLEMLRKGNLNDAISSENSHLVANAESLIEQFRQDLANDKWSQEYMEVARGFFDGKAKDAINTTMLALKHRIVAKDKNYIPFEVDKNFVVREISAANDIQQTINAYGMLQETKDKAPQPLIMTGLNNIIDRHIDQVSAVVGLAIPVRNFNKVWNVHSVEGVNTTVNNAIETNWGKEGKKFIEQVVQDIQGPRHNSQSKIYKAVKSGYIGATFLLNGSVVTKQIGSLFSSTSMLRWRDPASMIGNLLYTMANYKKISAEVDKYTASAWTRRQGMSDAEVYTLITEGKKHPITKAFNKLPAVFNPSKWITAMDSAVALSLWKYAKQDVQKAHPELSGEELNRATASFYDSVIENTQSMTDVLHRPEIQKRSDVVSEAFGMFKTDLYQMSGQLQNTLGRFGENKSKENAKALGRTVYSIAASAAWGSLMTTVFALLRYKVKPYRDDEDDELTVESWLKRQAFALGGDLMGYALPLFGSEVIGTIENIVYGESEDIADSLALTAINDLYSSAVTIASSLKEGEAPSADDYKKLLTKSLQVFGIPANNIVRTIEAIILHAEDIANGEFFSFEAGREKTNGQRLYESILRGNKEQIEKLKLEFKDEKAIETALKTALRENDPRIKEAAQARIGGDISKYKDIVRGITSEGHFNQDLVVKAVNAEINKINKEADEADSSSDDEEEENKETSIYKASDINAALENGDTSDALEVINDLVRVKTENYIAEGKSKKEAEKNAKSSVRSSVTSYWKPLYLAAYKSKNSTEMTRIRKLLKATNLYDNVVETCQDWVKQSKKSN